MEADADANADAGGNAIALPGLRPGELKIKMPSTAAPLKTNRNFRATFCLRDKTNEKQQMCLTFTTL